MLPVSLDCPFLIASLVFSNFRPLIIIITIRDRPFNLEGGGGYGFLFRSEFFFPTTRELEYLFFLSCKARIFFSRIPH